MCILNMSNVFYILIVNGCELKMELRRALSSSIEFLTLICINIPRLLKDDLVTQRYVSSKECYYKVCHCHCLDITS